MAVGAFYDEHKAKKHHDCSYCRSEICPSEYYKREAVPPWSTGDGYWFVTNKCQGCW